MFPGHSSTAFNDQQQLSSIILASQLKDRSTIAFEHLYLNYSAALNGVILRNVKDCQVAEELLHNVFLKIWLHIDRYEESKGSLFTWMLGICRNEVIDHLRSRCARKWKMTICMGEQMPERASQPFWDRPDLEFMLSQLSSRDRVIIDLVYCQGFSFGQTAEILSMPVGSVKTRARQVFLKWKGRTGAKSISGTARPSRLASEV